MMAFADMNITSAVFLKSAAANADLPRDKKQHIIFMGRSNVGKSSLLNALTRTKGLAHVSKTPGRTRLINLFDINHKLYFVDLPGYGYAKVPRPMETEIADRISNYVHECEKIKLAILICDAKIGPTESDMQTRDLLKDAGIPIVPIANKWDALNSSEKAKSLNRFSEAFPGIEIVPHSVSTGEGRERILGLIGTTLKG